ncbi:manganese-dependent inorganic pyrophosphatase [Patescibacteria group bacterium]
MKTYIIGHRKPDTDSVVAPMALAYLYKQKDCFGYENPTPVITEEINPETKYLLEKFNVQAPQIITSKDIDSQDRVVLIDHNEESQRLEGLNPEQISDIIDHHKANINFNSPIYLTFKAWGSSATIVYFLMRQNDVAPDKTLASLMLAAILSDTVGFKSATCTPKDKEVGKELAEIAEITDLESFTLEIFKAKSNISNLSDEQIVKNDYKVFEFDQKTFIDQLETVEQEEIISNKKEDLLKAMHQVKQDENVQLLFVAVTDVLKVNTKLLVLGDEEKEVAQKAFGGNVENNVLDIGSKMSRKKEIAPAIEKALSK